MTATSIVIVLRGFIGQKLWNTTFKPVGCSHWYYLQGKLKLRSQKIKMQTNAKNTKKMQSQKKCNFKKNQQFVPEMIWFWASNFQGCATLFLKFAFERGKLEWNEMKRKKCNKKFKFWVWENATKNATKMQVATPF